jgi:hypothetical protein
MVNNVRIVKCRSCSTKNKIPNFKINLIPICGSCSAKLPEGIHFRLFRLLKFNWEWCVLIIVIGSLLLIDRSVSSYKHSTTKAPSCSPVFVKTGIYQTYLNNNQIAPLSIVTSTGLDYFVKIVDATTNQTIIEGYIIGGMTLDINVPLGSYRLKYASGNTWCGRSELFGNKTQYDEAQSTFNFSLENGVVSGYTVELIAQSNGNLQTRRISSSNF